MDDREAVRRWARGHELAQERIRREEAETGPLDPETSFAIAVELCNLVDMNAPDPIRERDVEEARATWRKLESWAAAHR